MTGVRLVALTAALLTASCGAPLLKLPTGPGAPASDSASLLDAATSACRRVSTISAELAVSGSVGGRRVRGRLLIGLAAPDALYVEAPAPFGAPLFVLGASHGDATLLLPRDRRVLVHGQPVQVLEALTGVPLDPIELKSTLTGCAASAASDAEEGRALGADWRLVGGDRLRYLRRDRDAGAWRLVSVVRSGEAGWRADYANFADNLPRTIRLVSSDPRRFDLRLELSQVELNAALAPSTFQVSVPAGTPPITLDDLRASGPLSR
jgi:hypothetical protein